ncbi:MAG: PqqD family protein [Actinomycetota bacterium]
MVSKPIFDYGLLEYYRNERAGYMTIVPKLHPETQELIMNPTAVEVLTLCDGRHTVEEIISVFIEKYPFVDSSIITNDINATLASYSRLGLISWDGEDPYRLLLEVYLGDEVVASIAREEDLPVIIGLLERFGFLELELSNIADHIIYKSPLLVHNELKLSTLRNKLFSFFEDFFLLRKNGKPIGIVSFQMPFEEARTAAILKVLICPVEIFEAFLSYALQELRKVAIRQIQKVKALIECSNHNCEFTKAMLNRASFIQESELKDEVGKGSRLVLMSYFYAN